LAILAERRGRRIWPSGAVEGDSVHDLAVGALRRMARPGEAGDLPPPRKLRLDDRPGAKGVAALQRQRMIEDVQDAHEAPFARASLMGRQPRLDKRRPMTRLKLAFLPALILTVPLAAQDRGRAFTVVETGQGFGTLADAIAAIAGGEGTIRIAPGRYRQCAVQEEGRIAIVGNSFDDSAGRDTNYMIDLPEGSVGRIAGNVFVQGLGKENYGTLIAVHAEEGDHPSAGLVIEDNVASVAPGFPWTTVFVGDWSGEALVVRNNRLGPRITAFERR